ncbi:MAG: 30S ribosomal protein S4 [Oscillospiraceae bacterium]|jgi:small subunit ribosomal protein S4|nr:30S ribosomal protein S4 [Oscillospiraceae bacterium]
MARDFTPAVKRCRELGIEPSVLGLAKKPSRRKVNERRKVSEYGLQLREKQKAKFIYGVLERQFHNTYLKASKMHGMTGENLLSLLERRLDNVIFRLGFARTRKEARQIVSHSHVSVNGRKVNIPSYAVKVGDVVEIREASRSSSHFKLVVEETHRQIIPSWLQSDRDNLKGKVLSLPLREEIDVPVEERQIVELYSK